MAIKIVKDLSNLSIEDRFNYMTKLGKSNGFFQLYFDCLSQFPTQIETFNYVNDLYFELWGEYKYSYYDSFRNSLRLYLSK